MSETVHGDDMTPLQRAASALLSDLHNSKAVSANDILRAAQMILAALEGVAAAEREALSKIVADIALRSDGYCSAISQEFPFCSAHEKVCDEIQKAIRSRGSKT